MSSFKYYMPVGFGPGSGLAFYIFKLKKYIQLNMKRTRLFQSGSHTSPMRSQALFYVSEIVHGIELNFQGQMLNFSLFWSLIQKGRTQKRYFQQKLARQQEAHDCRTIATKQSMPLTLIVKVKLGICVLVVYNLGVGTVF